MKRSSFAQTHSDAVVTRLRLKIVAITLGALLIIIIAMLTALNMFMQRTGRMQTRRLLDTLVENREYAQAMTERFASDLDAMASGPMPQMVRSTRFLTANLNEDGEIVPMDTLQMLNISEAEAASLVRRAFESGKPRGVIDAMQYTVVKEDGGYFTAFVEQSDQNQLLHQLQRISIFVALVSSIALLVLATLLSIWITRPIQQSLQQQKAFISDASHEMKTPLTIISANADVLVQRQGDNKWVSTIQSQAQKLSELVHDLLLLARTSEVKPPVQMERINLSEVALNASLAFESPMFEAGKAFTMQIEENIHVCGNAANLDQLIHILLDNAMKYSNERSAIHIALQHQNSRAQLTVYNTGNGLSRDEMGKVFRRFYRSDVSRSKRAGGYGLGLSIAQAIVQQHQGRISVSGEEGKDITFMVSLKLIGG